MNKMNLNNSINTEMGAVNIQMLRRALKTN